MTISVAKNGAGEGRDFSKNIYWENNENNDSTSVSFFFVCVFFFPSVADIFLWTIELSLRLFISMLQK